MTLNIVNDISLKIEIKFKNKFKTGKAFLDKLKFFNAAPPRQSFSRNNTEADVRISKEKEENNENDKSKTGNEDSNPENEVNNEENRKENKTEDKEKEEKEENKTEEKEKEEKEENKTEEKEKEEKEVNKKENKIEEKENRKENEEEEEKKENEDKEKEEKEQKEENKSENKELKEEIKENERNEIKTTKNEEQQLQNDSSKNEEKKEEIGAKKENLPIENKFKGPKPNIEDLQEEINRLKKINEEKDIKMEELLKKLKEKDDELSSKEIKNIKLEDQIAYYANLKQKIKKEEENKIKNHENINKKYLKANNSILYKEAILRCLSQTEKLTEYFRNDDYKDKIINNNIALKNKNDYQLSPAYYDFINKIEKNGNKIDISETLINIIEKINSSNSRGKANNTKMFLIFILKQLHNELKQAININNNNDKNNKNLDIYNKFNALNYSLEEFKKGCSIITDIFYGFRENILECLNCSDNQHYYSNNYNFNSKKSSYNYGTFNCLLFSLEKIKNFYQTNNISLYDCFKYGEEKIIFNGTNKYYCNICNGSYECQYTSRIYSSPLVFIMIFDRKKDNLYDVKLNYNEEIDITQYILNKDDIVMYQLYSMITYTVSDNDIKYFAICKNLNDGKWYRYYEDKVIPISDIKKDIDKNEIAYILFYQKKER